MDTRVQILSVGGRPTRNGSNMYEVAASDGNKYTTFNAELANRAAQLQGQQVDLRYDIVNKSTALGPRQYVNLVDVAPIGQLPPEAGGSGNFMPNGVGTVIGSGAQGPSPQIQMQGPRQSDDQRQLHIERQTAAKTAFEFIGKLAHSSPAEIEGVSSAVKLARALTDDLLRYFQTGSFEPGQEVAQPMTLPNGTVVPPELAALLASGAVSVGAQPEPEEPKVRSDIPWNN